MSTQHTPGPWAADLSAETVTGADGNTVVYELNTNDRFYFRKVFKRYF